MSTNRYTRLAGVFLFLAIGAAALGLVDSFLVHLEEFTAQSNPSVLESCNINSALNCAPVLNSPYARIFTIPVSLIGILFDEAMLAVTLAIVFGLVLRRWQAWAISGIVLVSWCFSNYLIFMSYLALGVFCPYCLVSNISTNLLTICWFSFLYFRRTKAESAV
jgi:uncharacterized membrane protein